MRLPPEFVGELLAQLRAIIEKGGQISDGEASRLVGRAGRVAYVIPSAGPFAASLRAALEDSRSTAKTKRRAEQRGWHASQRFVVAAAWFQALLEGGAISRDGPLPLERLIFPARPADLVAGECSAIVFDASPWGGGAVLFEGRRPTEWMAIEWDEDLCHALRAERGQSAYLSFFEAFTALAALSQWCGAGQRPEVALVGGQHCGIDCRGVPPRSR